MTKHCLFFIYGETFRTGSQRSRIIGNAKSFDEQKKACDSHNKHIKHLQNKYNYSCDIIVSTYTTQYIKDLENWYNVKIFHQENNKIRHNHLIHLNDINLSKYDFVFHFRPDLYFKDHFITNIFNPYWKKLMFPSVCFFFNNRHITKNGLPLVNDTMMFVPKSLKELNFHKKLI